MKLELENVFENTTGLKDFFAKYGLLKSINNNDLDEIVNLINRSDVNTKAKYRHNLKNRLKELL
jgi:hypothetical protein